MTCCEVKIESQTRHFDVTVMTCCEVKIESQTRQFEFEAAIFNPKPAFVQLADFDVTKKYMILF